MHIHSSITGSYKMPPLSTKGNKNEKVKIPLKESAITSTIVGASLGTLAGEAIGGFSSVGVSAYGGYAAGSAAYGQVGGLVGAAVGATAGFFLERKFAVGQTLGAGVGFLTGGIVGGVTGVVIGGTRGILNSDFFQKS